MDMERMTDYEVISWANRCSKPVDEIVDICTNCPYFQEQEEKDNGMGCQELMVLDLAERLEKTLPPDDRGEHRKENHDMEEQKVTTNQEPQAPAELEPLMGVDETGKVEPLTRDALREELAAIVREQDGTKVGNTALAACIMLVNDNRQIDSLTARAEQAEALVMCKEEELPKVEDKTRDTLIQDLLEAQAGLENGFLRTVMTRAVFTLTHDMEIEARMLLKQKELEGLKKLRDTEKLGQIVSGLFGDLRRMNEDRVARTAEGGQSFGEMVEKMKNAVKEARENTVKGIREAVDALPLTDEQRCEILKARVEELEKQLEGRSEAFGNRVEELEGQLDECRKVRAQEREREFDRYETVNNLLKDQLAQNRDLVHKLNACLMTGAVKLVQVDGKWKAFRAREESGNRLASAVVKRLENKKQRAQVTCDSSNFMSIMLEGRKR